MPRAKSKGAKKPLRCEGFRFKVGQAVPKSTAKLTFTQCRHDAVMLATVNQILGTVVDSPVCEECHLFGCDRGAIYQDVDYLVPSFRWEASPLLEPPYREGWDTVVGDDDSSFSMFGLAQIIYLARIKLEPKSRVQQRILDGYLKAMTDDGTIVADTPDPDRWNYLWEDLRQILTSIEGGDPGVKLKDRRVRVNQDIRWTDPDDREVTQMGPCFGKIHSLDFRPTCLIIQIALDSGGQFLYEYRADGSILELDPKEIKQGVLKITEEV